MACSGTVNNSGLDDPVSAERLSNNKSVGFVVESLSWQDAKRKAYRDIPTTGNTAVGWIGDVMGVLQR